MKRRKIFLLGLLVVNLFYFFGPKVIMLGEVNQLGVKSQTAQLWMRFRKKELTVSDIMRLILKSHMIVTKTSQNVCKICF